jgi:hypothetical protein
MNTIEGTFFERELSISHIRPIRSGLIRRLFCRSHPIFCNGKVEVAELPGEIVTATRRLAPLRIRQTNRLSGYEHAQDRRNRELYLAVPALLLLDPSGGLGVCVHRHRIGVFGESPSDASTA